MDFTSLIHIPSWANTLLVLILGGYITYQQIRGSTKTLDNSTITAYKENLAALNLSMDEYKEQVHQLTLKVGELTGINSTQKAQLERYEQIFANRNPDLVEILTELKDLMKDTRDTIHLVSHDIKNNAQIAVTTAEVAHMERNRK